MRAERTDWAAYLDRFHRDRPGITEDTLGQARHRDRNAKATDPYRWLAEPLPEHGTVLDLACGSGPMRSRCPASDWVGVDLSMAELSRAAVGGKGLTICAEAACLPVATGSCAAVVCSMALMVLQPLDAVIAEIRRVLPAGGTAVFLLPGRFPLTTRDLARYARLMVALRRWRLCYPNDRGLFRLGDKLRAAGFSVTDDRRRRFALPLVTGDAGTFVRSLYLPGTTDARMIAAAKTAGGWAGSDIGIPLRRVTARGD
jgi:SAM-dependent methyltransferase